MVKEVTLMGGSGGLPGVNLCTEYVRDQHVPTYIYIDIISLCSQAPVETPGIPS